MYKSEVSFQKRFNVFVKGLSSILKVIPPAQKEFFVLLNRI